MKLKAVYILLVAGLLVVITIIIMFIDIRNDFESILLDLEYIIEGE